MKNNLAAWSWILPVIGLVQSLIVFGVLANTVLQTTYPTSLGIRMFFLFDAIVFLICLVAGFIIGILSLVNIKNKPKLKGKSHAIIGIIISVLMSPLALYLLLGPLMGD